MSAQIIPFPRKAPVGTAKLTKTGFDAFSRACLDYAESLQRPVDTSPKSVEG
jgi:hypothetical protein